MKNQINALHWLIVIFLIFSFIHTCFAQNVTEQIDALFQPFIDNDLFHGRVLVAHKGDIIYYEGIGYANLEWKNPSSTATKYRIASISKQFTSLIILQLVAEGKLNLNGTITDYFPAYRKDTGDRVTIHQLMTHTSGIPNGLRSIRGFWSRSEHTLIHYNKRDFIKKFCSEDYEFEPGSQFRYTSVGYMILGAIIEEICGKSFPEVFQERIVDRLGLGNTVCDDNQSLVAHRSSGYVRDIFSWRNSKYHYMPILDGAGTVLTTTEDLYKYDQALYTESLLSADFRRMFFRPNEHFDDVSYYLGGSYSYGWKISYLRKNPSDSIKIVSHGGGIRGGSAYFARQIDAKNTVIILSNTEIGSRVLGRLSMDILKILNQVTIINPYKVSIKYPVAREIIENGIDSAIVLYKALRKNDFDRYDFREGQLNSLGYGLINHGKTKEAMKIFQLNIEVHPDYANGYDSLAEAYLRAGQEGLAVKYYQKALELNSENSNARDVLERLKK